MAVIRARKLITDADIPASIARDIELTSETIKTLSLFPRSSPASIDGNNCLIGAAAGFQWIDANVAHTNLSATTGLLMQFDPLFGTSLQALYKVQFFIPSSPATATSSFHIRHQNNGNWANWRLI